MVALAAVERLKKIIEPESFPWVAMVALPALDLFQNCTELDMSKQEIFALPAVAPLMKRICAPAPFSKGARIKKRCVIPELFIIPAPLRVSVRPELTVMRYGFVAAEVNVMPLTSVFADIETSVVWERPKVAI